MQLIGDGPFPEKLLDLLGAIPKFNQYLTAVRAGLGRKFGIAQRRRAQPGIGGGNGIDRAELWTDLIEELRPA